MDHRCRRRRFMPEYLIAFNDEWVPNYTVEEMAEKSRAVKALRAEMKAAGVYVFLGGLDDSAPVYGVEERDGSLVFIDGPYVETKEHLGGFVIIEVETEAEARDWAGGRRSPAVGHTRFGGSRSHPRRSRTRVRPRSAAAVTSGEGRREALWRRRPWPGNQRRWSAGRPLQDDQDHQGQTYAPKPDPLGSTPLLHCAPCAPRRALKAIDYRGERGRDSCEQRCAARR